MTDVSDWSDPCRDDREPDESGYLDWRAQHDYEVHCRRVHGGAHCNCPPPGISPSDPGFVGEPPF